MKRRSFLQTFVSFVCVLCLLFSLSFSGCAASDDAAAIIDGTLPMVQGIAAAVALANPALGLEINAAVALYTGGVHEFDTVYAQWKAAPPDQQPSLSGKVQAAAQILSQNLTGILNASRVVNVTIQNTIDLFFAAASGAVVDVLNFVDQVKAKGGTTTAAVQVYEEMFAGREPQPQTGSAAGKPAKAKKPTLAVNAAHSHKDLAKKLQQKTGNAQLDAIRADVASKLSKK